MVVLKILININVRKNNHMKLFYLKILFEILIIYKNQLLTLNNILFFLA